MYVCPEATAAVFIQPQLHNLLFKPKRNLVIGLGFLTQMNDNEIKAMLYHEFGHYVQEEMKSSARVYTIGQFSKSFVAINSMKKLNTWHQQMLAFRLLFTYYTIWVCHGINKSYTRLAKQMEYDADDVAVKHMGAATLQRALLHAACIRFNYGAMKWGLKRLRAQGVHVDNVYLALQLIGSYSRPSRKLLSHEVMKRIERLGQLSIVERSRESANSVRQSALKMLSTSTTQQNALCSARQFAEWLRPGISIYAHQKQLATSVAIEIHLDRRKHKLPWIDGFYKILLDSNEIGAGNFIKGYTLKRRTSPGKHTLSIYAPTGIISVPFEFEVEANNCYHIEMDYKVIKKTGYYEVFATSITRKEHISHPTAIDKL